MGRKFIVWVLGYAWMLLLLGLGGLGMAVYASYSAGHGGGAPDEAELTTVAGSVVAGREMTLERKRRRGGTTTSQFYELDLKPDAGGELVKLRVDHAIPRAQLEPAIGERVTARHDPANDNMVYEIKAGQTVLVAFADMRRILVAKAQADRDFFASADVLGMCALAAALGGGGVYLRRRLMRAAA